jgi:hypothetical protein
MVSQNSSESTNGYEFDNVGQKFLQHDISPDFSIFSNHKAVAFKFLG